MQQLINIGSLVKNAAKQNRAVLGVLFLNQSGKKVRNCPFYMRSVFQVLFPRGYKKKGEGLTAGYYKLRAVFPSTSPVFSLALYTDVHTALCICKSAIVSCLSCFFYLPADACSARGCKKHPTTGRPSSPADGKYDGVVLGKIFFSAGPS